MLTLSFLARLINYYEFPVMLLPIDHDNFTLSFVCFESDRLNNVVATTATAMPY